MKTLLKSSSEVPEVEGRGSFEQEVWDRHAFPLNTVIHELCHAFSTEIIPCALRIECLFCPWPHNSPDGVQCHLCRDVVRSFPMKHLVGTTAAGGGPGRTFHPMERRMMEILVGRLQQISLEEVRPTAMILYRHLQAMPEDW